MTKGGVADKGGMEVRANADITDKKSLKWANMQGVMKLILTY